MNTFTPRRSLVAGLALVVLACSGATPRAPDDMATALSSVSRPDAGASIQLLAFAFADTIRAADSFGVTVVFRGDSAWRQFHYDFGSLDFDVIAPDGRPLPLVRLYATTSGQNVSLEPYGFWGMPIALACPPPAAPSFQWRCDWNFRLDTPGTYRVVARYATPAPPDVTAPIDERDFTALTSDTVRIVYAPRLGGGD